MLKEFVIEAKMKKYLILLIKSISYGDKKSTLLIIFCKLSFQIKLISM